MRRRPARRIPAACLAVTAALVAMFLAGCGSARSTPRQALRHYLVKVNAVERQLVKPLAQVTKADAQFAHDQSHRGAAATFDLLTRAPQHELLQADAQVRSLGGQLAAIPVPATARQLRTLVLRLIEAQSKLTRLSAKLVVFLPGFAAAMTPLGPALHQLERVLSVNQASGAAAVQAVYTEKESALLRFRATLDHIVRVLRHLPTPRPLKPNYQAQLRAVQGMSLSAGRLARALQQGSGSAIPQLLTSFDNAAVLPQTLPVQKAEIAAIKTYNAQVRHLTALAEQAQRERQRLVSELG